MKTIGLIGGMSWILAVKYYLILNEATARILGNSHSAKIILFDVTAEGVKVKGIRRIGLLGTQYTMESPFFTQRLSEFGTTAIEKALNF